MWHVNFTFLLHVGIDIIWLYFNHDQIMFFFFSIEHLKRSFEDARFSKKINQ